MRQSRDKTCLEEPSPAERWTVDDVDCYARLNLGLRDDEAVYEQQQMLERGRLRLHWRCISGPDIGQEGEIPSISWHSQLRVARDRNSNKARGPIDFATLTVTARNDGHVFVETLVAQDRDGNAYELTVSARDARMVWAEQFPTGPGVVFVEQEDPLVTAIKVRIAAGYEPGLTEQWNPFCDNIRKSCGARNNERGYGDESIKRVVRKLRKVKQIEHV
jgi:hypothetical protein